MKKIVLLATTIFAFMAVNSLPVQAFSQNKEALNLISEKTQSSNQVVNDLINPEQSSGNNKTVNVVAIGSSANAFGLSGAARNILWADNQLNTITFIHRMNNPPGSGNIAFSYSVDGGLTWNINNQILSSQYNARWPQGVIYNPTGNVLPEIASFTYFSPSMPSGNYVSGTCNLNVPLNPTHNLWEGEITDAIVNFIINPVSGNTFSVAAGTDEFVYSGDLVLTKGVFNIATNDFDYSQTLIPLPTHPQGNLEAPVDIRIAFAPDGLVGYISVLWDNMLDTHAGGQGYYPILFKTTDGGNTWDSPEAIIIGGSEGFSAVKNYLNDDELEDIFGSPIPDRNSLIFTTAYDHGLAVDVNGNPHIGVTVGLINTNPYIIYGGNDGYTATFHFYKSATTQAFEANLVNRNKTFRGYFGFNNELSEDNRTQVSVTQDGSKIFVSWLDTDFEGISDNTMPDIYCWGFDAMKQSFTHVANVTQSSEAWFEAFNGTASHYVFSNQNSYTIPFVYQTITDFDPLSPVDYKYINDFSFTDSDFISGVTVDFIVQDINNVPVAGALITLDDITNPAGNYVFHNITPGVYNYTIEKYGFNTYTGVVNITDQNETITVTLENSGFAMIIRDVTAIAGDDILVELEINNEDSFITFQADILLPDGFGFIEGSAQLNPERITDHSTTAHVLPETNILRCLALSLTNDSFIGNSGVIASFMLTTPTTPGIYELVLINGGQ
ncbi:MAG: carboxypeptidase regulatory-like domain-containing protein, partial [Bacteroidales bacterium]|nr:carboxypeptidase regulatory-like domain-containing protein [Bacteroidales bacterium]